METVSLIDAAEARERGLYAELESVRFEGSWEARIGWQGTARQTQLRFTIEATGRLEVTERVPWPGAGPFPPIDAGAAGCMPSAREELRVYLSANDGSLEGQLETALSSGFDFGGYRMFSLRDRSAELRGNLELDIDWRRQPRTLEVALGLFDLQPDMEDRVKLEVLVHYGVDEVQTSREVLATAQPVDGCLAHQLRLDGDCVALSQHPAYRRPLPEEGAGIESEPDAAVEPANNPSHDAGARGDTLDGG